MKTVFSKGSMPQWFWQYNLTTDYYIMLSKMKFSQNCSFGLFDNVFVRFVSQAQGYLYQMNFPLQNYTIQAVSYSFTYSIAQS